MSKSEWPKKTPVVPEWCDCNTYTLPKRITFIGILRAAIALISFGLCVAFLVVFDTPTGVQVILGIIISVNLIHFFVSAYYISIGQSGNARIVKRWFQIDMTITGIFVILVLILLFTIPAERLYVFLGVKLIVLSLLLCYRYTMNYIQLTNMSSQFPTASVL